MGFFLYSTKFADDKWMLQNGMKEPDGPLPTWWTLPVSSLNLPKPIAVTSGITCSEAVRIMKREKISQIPVLNEEG